MASLVIQDTFEPYYAGREVKADKPDAEIRRAILPEPAIASDWLSRRPDQPCDSSKKPEVK